MIYTLIFSGLLLWGLYIAGGVLWNGLNPMRALILMACVVFFLGFWAFLLSRLKRS